MKIRLISFLLIACVLFTLASCNKYGIEEEPIELVFPTSLNREMTLSVGEVSVNNYIMYKGIIDFSANDIVFISSNPDVVSVEIATQEFPIYTYFDIKAHSAGEALIHAEACGGTVFSELIRVLVVEPDENDSVGETVSTSPKTDSFETETLIETAKSEIELEIEPGTEQTPETVTQELPPIVDEPATESKTSSPDKESETERPVYIIVTDEDELEPPRQTQEPVVTETESKTEAITEAATEPQSEKIEDDIQNTYVLNISSKKFHYPTCSFVNRMKEENKQSYTGTREALIADGYSACKTCKC